MQDNKKFYWIKLKTNFFSREDIDFLLSQKNGAEYVVLYQMLCLNTVNNDGRLESNIGEVLVPYNAEKIVRDCKHFDIDTVNVAMALYRKLGLIYNEENDNVFKISNYDEMVGSAKTDEHTRLLGAERQQRFRDRKKLISNDSNVTITEDITLFRNVEYRDKSIENRDIDIRDKENIDNIDNTLANTTLPVPTKKEIEEQYTNEFNKLWEYYPNKKGKDQSKSKYISARKNGTTYEEVANGLKNYLNYIKIEKVENKYIKHGSTWFNQKCWLDDYKIAQNNFVKKSDEQMEFLKGVHNGTIKIS